MGMSSELSVTVSDKRLPTVLTGWTLFDSLHRSTLNNITLLIAKYQDDAVKAAKVKAAIRLRAISFKSRFVPAKISRIHSRAICFHI